MSKNKKKSAAEKSAEKKAIILEAKRKSRLPILFAEVNGEK